MEHTAVIPQSSVSTGRTLFASTDFGSGTQNPIGYSSRIFFSYDPPQNIILFYWQIIVETAKQILQDKWELGRKLKKVNLVFEDLSLKVIKTYTPI